jgi:hypothetical protein
MLHFPLLSHVYEAALSAAALESRAEHLASHSTSCPAQAEPSQPGFGEDDRNRTNSTDTPAAPDDMETARTRPLRRDRFQS